MNKKLTNTARVEWRDDEGGATKTLYAVRGIGLTVIVR